MDGMAGSYQNEKKRKEEAFQVGRTGNWPYRVEKPV
jgi:hypothetical protein